METKVPTINPTQGQPTPAEIAAAQAVLAKVNTPEEPTETTDHSDLPDKPAETDAPVESSSTSDGEPSPTECEVTIDPVKKEKLEVLFAETINNPRFLAKESRYTDLIAALTIPVFDDRSLQQFYNHAKDDLTNEAAVRSAKEGLPVVLPTEEEVKAEAWERYTKKQMVIERKALLKERKKESERTGNAPVPVKEEEVKARVKEIVAKLRETEGY